MGEFRMPSLGADMDAGTVSQWLVSRGDEVHRGDIVAVVETEKSTIEVEIFDSGVIEEILVPAGERVPVGTVLARVASSAPAARPPSGAPPPAGAPPVAVVVPVGSAAPAVFRPARVPPGAFVPARVVSPLVRHLADQLGVDVSALSGSGPGGTVTRGDVETAARRGAAPAVGRVRSSPLARRLGAELGIDLSLVAGTGPRGAVVERDVRQGAWQAAPAQPVAPTEAGPPTAGVESAVATPGAPRLVAEEARPGAAGTDVEKRQAAMRAAIGALMARSKREIPHYYLSTTIDLSATTAWLERANLDRPVTERLVLPVLLLKATALAVVRVPEMNGFMVDDVFVPGEAVHVGVAVSLRTGGVIAPAIHHTDTLSLDELMASLRDLVGRARKGVLRSSEMSDPTLTVTNLGDLGVDEVFGVIYPPQVALVGFGRPTPRPWASEGMIGVRTCVTTTLSADHRASDGHRGGLFLTEIDRLLQEPEKL